MLLVVGHACRFNDRLNILVNVELAKYGGLLRQVADTPFRALIHRQPCDFMLIEKNLATGNWYEADDHVKSGGLSGTVWTEQTDDLTAGDFEINVIDHSAFPVDLFEFFRFDELHNQVLRAGVSGLFGIRVSVIRTIKVGKYQSRAFAFTALNDYRAILAENDLFPGNDPFAVNHFGVAG